MFNKTIIIVILAESPEDFEDKWNERNIAESTT